MVKTVNKHVEGKIYRFRLSALSVPDDYPFRLPQVTDDIVADLAEDIGNVGIHVPLVICSSFSNKFTLIDGYKRKAAAEFLNLPDVPAVLLNVGIYEAKMMAIDEHIGAKNLLPSEKAKAYAMRYKLRSIYGMKSSLREISHLTGDNEEEVQNYISLSYLTADFLKLIDTGRLSVKSGVELSALSKVNQQKIYNYLMYDNQSSLGHQRWKQNNSPHVLSVEEARHIRNKVADVFNEGRRLSKQDIKLAFHEFA